MWGMRAAGAWKIPFVMALPFWVLVFCGPCVWVRESSRHKRSRCLASCSQGGLPCVAEAGRFVYVLRARRLAAILAACGRSPGSSTRAEVSAQGVQWRLRSIPRRRASVRGSGLFGQALRTQSLRRSSMLLTTAADSDVDVAPADSASFVARGVPTYCAPSPRLPPRTAGAANAQALQPPLIALATRATLRTWCRVHSRSPMTREAHFLHTKHARLCRRTAPRPRATEPQAARVPATFAQTWRARRARVWETRNLRGGSCRKHAATQWQRSDKATRARA